MIIDGNVIKAENGKILVCGDVKSFQVHLSKYDSVDNWCERDMTPDEAEQSVDKAQKEEKIAELKQQLADTNDKAIEYAEGWISKEEYEPIRLARQKLRDEINELESLM